jgi:hypothetical protein
VVCCYSGIRHFSSLNLSCTQYYANRAATLGTLWDPSCSMHCLYLDGGYVICSYSIFVFPDVSHAMQAPFMACGGVGMLVAAIVLLLIPDKPRAIVSSVPSKTTEDASKSSDTGWLLCVIELSEASLVAQTSPLLTKRREDWARGRRSGGGC